MSILSHSKDLYFTYLVVHICRLSKESLLLAFWNTSKATSSLNCSACQIRTFFICVWFLDRSWCLSYYWFLFSMVLFHFIPSWFAWDCTYVWFCSFSDVHIQFPWVLYVVWLGGHFGFWNRKDGDNRHVFPGCVFLPGLEEFNFDSLILKY